MRPTSHRAVLAAALLLACGSPDSAPGLGRHVPARGPSPVFAECPVLPADDPWNADVSAAPVDARSEALLAAMFPEDPLKLALGTTEPHFGQPIAVVPRDQPLAPIAFGTGGEDYSGESDPGPLPIPLDVRIQGGGPEQPDPASGDRHVVVVQRETCALFELYNTERIAGGFRVSAAARWDLRTGAPRPPGWTSADAAGLPIFPGLLRWEEVEAGRIAHALRFTLPRGGGSFVAPANHCVGPNPDDPPFGTRVRLRADFDETPYGPATRVLLRALKTHGMIFADVGSAWSISGASHPGFEAILRDLREKPIPGSAFEVVAMGAVVTDC
jgi:hypothetical protein